ncbi:unnamed protein product, partial [Tuber aestivum]
MRTSFVSALLGVFALSGAAQASDEYPEATGAIASQYNCRCFPGDPCWPSIQKWGELNTTVSGKLIATVPLGTPCHAPDYDASRCQYIKENWHSPELHDESSSSIMAPFYANRSC